MLINLLTTVPGSFSNWSWGAHMVTRVRTSCFGDTRSMQSVAVTRKDLTALEVR